MFYTYIIMTNIILRIFITIPNKSTWSTAKGEEHWQCHVFYNQKISKAKYSYLHTNEHLPVGTVGTYRKDTCTCTNCIYIRNNFSRTDSRFLLAGSGRYLIIILTKTVRTRPPSSWQTSWREKFLLSHPNFSQSCLFLKYCTITLTLLSSLQCHIY